MHKEYSMVQRRRTVRMRILLIMLAALLILGVGLLVIRLTGTGASLQSQQTHLFQVGAHPLVTVSGRRKFRGQVSWSASTRADVR